MNNRAKTAVLVAVVLAVGSLAAGEPIALLDTNGFEAFNTGSISGQDGWTGNAVLFNGGANAMWKDVYTDSEGEPLPGMPGIGVQMGPQEARKAFADGGTNESVYTVNYSMYLGTYGAGSITQDMQLEQFVGSTRYLPVTVRVTNVGSGSVFSVQAIESNLGGDVLSTLYDSGAIFKSADKVRLDIQLTVDLNGGTYDLAIQEWTPATWNSGTPAGVYGADDLALLGAADVELRGIRFMGRGSNSNATLYDNVTVSATVPEPMTMMLLSVGLPCLVLRRR